MTHCAILIPAYQPRAAVLLDLIRNLQRALQRHDEVIPIWIVNDGSDADHDDLFRELEAAFAVHVVRHAINLGKGAALKTGINAILTHCPSVQSIITADADGQHLPEDIVRLLDRARRQPTRLCLGVRRFDRGIPLRSRFGNVVTLNLTRFLTGLAISDTQTGLRAIPRDLCEVALRIPLNGYDFEMECLIAFRRAHAGHFRVEEIPVRTVYIDGNRDSHFNPLLDSMRIYFVFLRYCAGSLLTFITDYLIFIAVFAQMHSIGIGMICARTASTFVSFFFNRQAVFHAKGHTIAAFLRFVLLVTAFGGIAYLATSYLARVQAMPVVYAKLLVEGVLYFAGFALNNLFVFNSSTRGGASADADEHTQVHSGDDVQHGATPPAESVTHYAASPER
jgi:glycosyltransferase involved in cell wall biosynthesis